MRLWPTLLAWVVKWCPMRGDLGPLDGDAIGEGQFARPKGMVWTSTHGTRGGQERTQDLGLQLNYTLRLSDLVWMYLGSWGARIAAAPGLFFLLIVLAAWPPPADVPLASYLGWVGVCVTVTMLGPLFVLYGLLGMYGTRRLVGTTIYLTIDPLGVSGWPLEPEMDRTWPRIRRARELRGVITLPFRQFGTRAGWVPVPKRAFTPEQLSEFCDLLASKGLMKPRRASH